MWKGTSQKLKKALSRAGGRHIGLQNRGVNIRWFGERGMLWSELTATVEKKIDSLPLPFLLVIQLGSNDLGKVSSYATCQYRPISISLHTM
jgi:hypothetical protein